MTRATLLATLLVGCFKPQPPGDVACSSLGTCPSGLSCIDGRCVTPGTEPIDAPVVMLDAPDAARPIDASFAFDFTPSNAVDPHLVDGLAIPIVISGATTFDTDSGQITGAITRAAGTGVSAQIAFATVGGIDVFGFADLTLTTAGTITFTGVHPVAFLVGNKIVISGTIDGTGGQCTGDPGCPGPGGGRGALATDAAGGCGPGGPGLTNFASNSDPGGGGGGGGGAGAHGGAATSQYPGGAGGPACLATTLEPLAGGSGGGGGGTGATTPSHGGGGGGALQITARVQIKLDGTITMGGGGGENGYLDPGAMTNGSGGGGGGAGGGILLEAPMVSLGASSILAANGGGGGAGGVGSTSNGQPGEHGHPSATPAAGGTNPSYAGSDGGNGAAGSTAAIGAGDSGAGDNGGGGGGGVGSIELRAQSAPMLVGLQSPAAGTGLLKP